MEIIVNPDAPPSPSEGTPSGAGPASANLIKDSDTARFAADVIEPSRSVPVIVDFWAPWCGPCKQLGPLLERLVTQAGGLVRLVKINVDENQPLAQQMQIQSIPAVYAFKDGHPVDGFVGAQPESQVKALIQRLIGDAKPPLEQALELGEAALEAGDIAAAGGAFSQALGADPENARAIAGLARCYMAAGDNAKARDMLEKLPPKIKATAEITAVLAALDLAGQASEAGDVAELSARLESDPNDHQARFDLSAALYAQGRNEDAVNQLLDLVGRNRAWNEDAARKQLLKIFEALGPSDPITVSGRQKLSTVLFS
ncbi:MAG: thioredoxin [Rhodospirillales bacterium]|nr:thioredoxin [Rhodospirillales bacterium]